MNTNKLPRLTPINLNKVEKKKILLLSDDLRIPSGVGTMSKALVFGSVDKYDFVQIGGAVKHPEAGKGFDVSSDISKLSGVSDASVMVFAVDGYGDPQAIFGETAMRHEFIDAVDQLRFTISNNKRNHDRVRENNRRVQNLGREYVEAQEKALMNEFFYGIRTADGQIRKPGWVERIMNNTSLTEAEALNFLLHHFVQPEPLTGRYTATTIKGNTVDMPFYRMNNRGVRSILQFFTEQSTLPGPYQHLFKPIVDNFIQNWEGLVRERMLT